MPLVTFINEVFAERLGMSFTLSAGLSEKTDLVTLRLTEPVPPQPTLRHRAPRARGLRREPLREAEGVLTFVADQEVGARDIPLLISGRALPEVPPTHRTAFQLVPMHVGRVNIVAGFLSQVFTGQDLQIRTDIPSNTLLLRGTMEMLERAAEMIEVLDQPLLRGRHGVIIDPSFLAAADLATDLEAVLAAEGYSVGTGGQISTAVILLPLRSVNKLVAFASDAATLNHIREWARTLDAQKEATVENAGVHLRGAQHPGGGHAGDPGGHPPWTAAAVGAKASKARPPTPPAASRTPTAAPAASSSTRTATCCSSGGSGKEWAELRAVIEQLDKPVPSVLIELLIAEITLSDEEESGIEFLFRNGIGGGDTVTSSTLGALGVQAKALSMTLDSAGTTRAVLNLFYEDSRVAIRSSARLMVKSGETASFDAGNEIPTISQLADAGTQAGGSTNVLQQVTYRKTGVLLDIEPVVQANGLVDLAISQELSEARPTAATSLDGTPTILSRSVSTNLTLRDGGSLLMGGLVSNSQSVGEGGVPGLGRVPVLGRLFRKDAFRRDRTELAILVIPYVVADHREGRELTERIKAELDLHGQFLR